MHDYFVVIKIFDFDFDFDFDFHQILSDQAYFSSKYVSLCSNLLLDRHSETCL